MNNPRQWARPLLWFHLCVMLVWLYLFRAQEEVPLWMGHVAVLSILVIQFTWGFTVGLSVGPSRKNRQQLWWSLLPIFLPLWIYGGVAHVLFWVTGPFWALLYLAAFTIILGCETYCGVLLGAKTHAESDD